MKRILITGANSYVGTSFEKYISQWPGQYHVDTLDMVGEKWKEFDFSGYDAVFHVAGIAHRKESAENAKLYYQVNCDLAITTAEKAKQAGVRQFIYLSSGSIYGLETGVITKDTVPQPKTHYGKSKLMAEQRLKALCDGSFKVALVRPLMVYGKGCKGNFQTVIKIVKAFSFFPAVHSKRSLIYIDNLSSFVKMLIDRGYGGEFNPANREDADIYVMAQQIAKATGKKLWMSSVLGMIIKVIENCFGITRKAFGDLRYEGMEQFGYEYCVEKFDESIRKSV